MEYKKIPIDELKPNSYNPNEMTEKMLQHLKKEIQRVGFVQPILINKNKRIIDGEHRWRAAKELNMEEIPVVEIDIDDAEAKITTVNMNQIKGEINPLKFGDLIKDLQNDYDLAQLSEYFNIDIPELESYSLLTELPDITPEDLVNQERQEKEIICPNCQHVFTTK